MPSRVMVALRVSATPDRAFATFVDEIGRWWRPNGLFRFHRKGTGRLRFEPGEGGRLVEALATGDDFEIGRITVWEPPRRLAFTWRQAQFKAGQQTEVHVRFEPAGEGTRVVVEHLGWDTVPGQHVAKHGFPEPVFLQRHGEWWQALLRSMKAAAEAPDERGGPRA